MLFSALIILSDWTDDDVAAQCMIFFLGGFLSISSGACFLFHELAMNPDIQSKLYNEINSIKSELNGSQLTYEIIPKLKYLDMVVSETFRRWCPIPFLERTCTKSYALENSNGENVQLNVGDGIFIPTYAIHMDQQYFPNPEKFDPERFSDENKNLIQSGTYLPFGSGPRKFILIFRRIIYISFNCFSFFFYDRQLHWITLRNNGNQNPHILRSIGILHR